MSRPTATQRIVETARNSRDERGVATMAAKDVATIIRARLKARFPGTKFQITSSYSSVDIRWTDGPLSAAVEEITGQYRFGGFDGSIDLAFTTTNWLLPDGSMEPAHSSGTVGSGGCQEGYATDCPTPGAVLVKFGPKYVFCHRRLSDERMAELVEKAVTHYGCDYDPTRPAHSQFCPRQGEWLTTLAYQFEQRHPELV